MRTDFQNRNYPAQINFIVLFLFIIFLPSSVFAENEIKFHNAKTRTEKILESILNIAGSDDDQLDNLFNGRGKTSYSKTVDYTSLLTRKLISSMNEVENKLVKESCNGKYIVGEICGLDYSPISCSQDVNNKHLYRTVKQNDNTAIILYKWSGDKTADIPIYKLIKDQKTWKLDAINCGNGPNTKFNWDDDK